MNWWSRSNPYQIDSISLGGWSLSLAARGHNHGKLPVRSHDWPDASPSTPIGAIYPNSVGWDEGAMSALHCHHCHPWFLPAGPRPPRCLCLPQLIGWYL